jgi:selenocysteine lyase/cysteine desulfurase
MDPKSKFLLLKNDYPSINDAVEASGFDTVYAPIDEQMEQHILDACELHRPDLFCFSVVQYISGIQIDLDFLKELKVQFPHLIIVGDLTQYIGCEEFRFRESGLDIIIASCYKWLHAGDGNGFIAIKKNVEERTVPNKNRDYSKNHPDEISTMITRFEPGHQDMTAFGSLQFAIEAATTIGIKNIEIAQKELSQLARSEFHKRGLLSKVVMGRADHSAIFNIKGDQQLYEKLLSHKIVTSLRGNGLRVSFSYLNTKDDLSRLLEVLDLHK